VCVCVCVCVCPHTEHPWSLWIWTSDIPSAGTDADICFQIYGSQGKSDEIRLDNKSDNFEQGQVDKFMVRVPTGQRSPQARRLDYLYRVTAGNHAACTLFNDHAVLIHHQVELPDMGTMTKFRIWHEKRNPFAGWHLSKVNMFKSNDKYVFYGGGEHRWSLLAVNTGGKHLTNELILKVTRNNRFQINLMINFIVYIQMQVGF